MSWDIFVQDLPEGIRSVAEIPDDFVPRDAIAKRSDVVRVVSDVAPEADFTDPEWIRIGGPGFSIELSLADREHLDGFAFFVRGSDEAAVIVAAILRALGMNNTQSTDLIFELSRPGRRCHRLPAPDVPAADVAALIPTEHLADSPPPLPEVGEIDLVRHYLNLSARNMSIDTNFYPLGSCTMKYNPKRHERLAALPGFAGLHPLQDDDTTQGMLELLYEMQQFLAEISGLPAVSLQPAAGAQGELTALFVAAAYFRDKGQTHRRKVLVPDSAHGTNPASAALAGFDAVTVKSNSKGLVDLEDLKNKLDDDTAVFMITNPNTLGLFEAQIKTITELLHGKGALVYLDGANMNAILGITRPGRLRGGHAALQRPQDVHRPARRRRPRRSGPIAVRDFLAPYLPAPLVVKDGDRYRLNFDMPKSIGRVRSFFGNVGILFRGILLHPHARPDGLREVSEQAVLNANYLRARVIRGVRRAASRAVHARVRGQRPGAAA
jgi:glycine dehydrogenase subunit 2